MNFGLKEIILIEFQRIFSSFPMIDQVIIYGSRVKGTYKPGSDIDLTIKGKYIDYAMIAKVELALDDLNLPYMIDITIYDKIKNQELIDHIDRIGVIIYCKAGFSE
ncbi:MAG: nucleotidyltransferase domain-containing protein [Bacteroidales bacterium]|nr:nucleotidyltransferase domain-containing protein [Bacteroidales bacterium]